MHRIDLDGSTRVRKNEVPESEAPLHTVLRRKHKVREADLDTNVALPTQRVMGSVRLSAVSIPSLRRSRSLEEDAEFDAEFDAEMADWDAEDEAWEEDSYNGRGDTGGADDDDVVARTWLPMLDVHVEHVQRHARDASGARRLEGLRVLVQRPADGATLTLEATTLRVQLPASAAGRSNRPGEVDVNPADDLEDLLECLHDDDEDVDENVYEDMDPPTTNAFRDFK